MLNEISFGAELEYTERVSQDLLARAIQSVGEEVRTGGYRHTAGNDGIWDVKTDSSCYYSEGNNGNEVASPILYGVEGIKRLLRVKRAIVSQVQRHNDAQLWRNGINNRCGYHVHMDLNKFPDRDRIQKIIYVTAWMEPFIQWLQPPDRRDYQYCRELPCNNDGDLDFSIVSRHNRRHGINLQHYSARGTIEYRYAPMIWDPNRIGMYVLLYNRMVHMAMQVPKSDLREKAYVVKRRGINNRHVEYRQEVLDFLGLRGWGRTLWTQDHPDMSNFDLGMKSSLLVSFTAYSNDIQKKRKKKKDKDATDGVLWQFDDDAMQLDAIPTTSLFAFDGDDKTIMQPSYVNLERVYETVDEAKGITQTEEEQSPKQDPSSTEPPGLIPYFEQAEIDRMMILANKIMETIDLDKACEEDAMILDQMFDTIMTSNRYRRQCSKISNGITRMYIINMLRQGDPNVTALYKIQATKHQLDIVQQDRFVSGDPIFDMIDEIYKQKYTPKIATHVSHVIDRMMVKIWKSQHSHLEDYVKVCKIPASSSKTCNFVRMNDGFNVTITPDDVISDKSLVALGMIADDVCNTFVGSA